MRSTPGRLSFLNAYAHGPELVTFRRGDRGQLVRQVRRAEYSCFLRKAEVSDELMRELRSSRAVAGVRDDGEHWRVLWADYELRKRACRGDGFFARRAVTALEWDVSPVRRWLTDEPVDIAKPRRVYFDIEADSRVAFQDKARARILCWAIVDDAGNRFTSLLEDESDDAEARVIDELYRVLEGYDQVLAWSGDRFDFPLLKAREERLGLRYERRRLLWLDQLELFRKMNASASESGDEKQSMALGNVAQALLGRGKIDSGALSWEMWSTGQHERLLTYCADDADLQRAIEAKTGYVELLQTLCESCTVFGDSSGFLPSVQVEGFLMRVGSARGHRFPARPWVSEDELEESKKFKGAYVMEPTHIGVLEDVHVCDFARLYPSIIQSWNMSPETWRESLRKPREPGDTSAIEPPAGHAVAPLTHEVFDQSREGILPEALRTILELRAGWGKKKNACPPGTPEWSDANRRDAAYKIVANSFYGVIGLAVSRFFVREVAESVATTSEWLIKATARSAEAWGMSVVYADTDSCFVKGVTGEEFRRFTEWCNESLYPVALKKIGCERNQVSLEYEKAFRRLLMMGKKRYAGTFSMFKGTAARADSKPEIKGLEYKRGDTARLARLMQERVVYMVIGAGREPSDRVEDYEEVLLEFQQLILEGEPETKDVVLAKKLAKPLRQYVQKRKQDGTLQARPTHVEVAELLKARGFDVGKGVRIEYVVIDGGQRPMKALPLMDVVDEQGRLKEWDRHYVWEDLVFPPTQRVLEAAFPAVPWGVKWGRTRPRRPRTRGRLVPEEQLGLFAP